MKSFQAFFIYHKKAKKGSNPMFVRSLLLPTRSTSRETGRYPVFVTSATAVTPVPGRWGRGVVCVLDFVGAGKRAGWVFLFLLNSAC